MKAQQEVFAEKSKPTRAHDEIAQPFWQTRGCRFGPAEGFPQNRTEVPISMGGPKPAVG